MNANTGRFDCSSYDESSNRTCDANSTKAAFGVDKGSRYRYRIINAGAFAEFQFSVDNHTLSVIETDGTTVQPLEIHRLSIHVAQRYSVVLSATQPSANYFIRATMLTNCFAVDNPVLNPFAVGILSYTNTATNPSSDSVDWADALPQECRDLNYTTLVPTEVRAAPPADVLYYFGVSFQIGAYALDRGYFNSTTWVPPTASATLNQAVSGLRNTSTAASFTAEGVSPGFGANQLVVAVPKRQTVDLLIQNYDDGAHPFHLHGHVFWIMAQSNPPFTTGYFPWETYDGLDATNPVRRDTLTLPAYGWALIRFEADHAGLWAFHCHIVWHMEAGLLMQFMTRVDLLEGTTVPEDVKALCDV
jgi:FtsP/CotA-like multicopper oxidase with cupredoxin domain